MINHMLAQWFVAFPLATKVQVEGCVFLGEKSADVSIFYGFLEFPMFYLAQEQAVISLLL